MEHRLKTWPDYFAAVADGKKTFEARVDDRGFSEGDVLVLQEYEPGPDRYTGREVRRVVTYIARDFLPNLPLASVVLMGIKPEEGA